MKSEAWEKSSTVAGCAGDTDTGADDFVPEERFEIQRGDEIRTDNSDEWRRVIQVMPYSVRVTWTQNPLDMSVILKANILWVRRGGELWRRVEK